MPFKEVIYVLVYLDYNIDYYGNYSLPQFDIISLIMEPGVAHNRLFLDIYKIVYYGYTCISLNLFLTSSNGHVQL